MTQWITDNWIAVVSMLAAVASAYFAWRALVAGKPKTRNVISGGNHNNQSGGSGVTDNEIRDGDGNVQKG